MRPPPSIAYFPRIRHSNSLDARHGGDGGGSGDGDCKSGCEDARFIAEYRAEPLYAKQM